MFNAKLLNDFYGKYDNDTPKKQFGKRALSVLQKYNNSNIDTSIPTYAGDIDHILITVCKYHLDIPNCDELFDYLISNGLSTNCINVNVLDHIANNAVMFSYVVSKGYVPNSKQDLTNYAVKYAISYDNHAETIIALHYAGADITGSIGYLIHEIIYDKCSETRRKIIQFLTDDMKININVFYSYKHVKCSVAFAVSMQFDMFISQEFVSKYGNIIDYKLCDGYNNTFLHYACEQLWRNQTHANRCSRLIEKIILFGADVNAGYDRGYTPLDSAFIPDIFQILIKHGAKTDYLNDKGENIFTITLRYHLDYDKIIKLCNNKRINTPDKTGKTTLMHLLEKPVDQDTKPYAIALIQCGADPRIGVVNGQTPEQIINAL